MEAKLHPSDGERLAETQQLAHLGSWAWDIPSDKVEWTEELYRIYGIKHGDPIDYEAYIGMIHPDDRGLADSTVKGAFGSGEPFVFTHRIVRPNGDTRWLEGRGRVIMGPDGPLRMFGTAQDITDKKQREDDLRRSLDEKDALLRELHHRVKNNLQAIASLLRLQADATKEAAPALLESRDRVHSMALVHEALYTNDLSEIDFPAYIERLCRDMQRAYGARDGVHLKVVADPIPISIENAAPAGLLVTELISNAFKHAFPEGKGEIRVEYTGHGKNRTITVADDGPGPTGTHQGLGTRLIEAFAAQLRGQISTNRHDGYKVTVQFEEP